jgi:membrane protein DedA with SNARE-associated domain
MTFDYLVSHYGYVALVVGTIFEGETILIAAGFAAHGGYLKLQWVVLAAFAGSLAGDQFYFFIGRLKGKAFLHRRPAWETKVERVLKLFDRYRTLVVLGFRFMYGLRTVTPFAFGLSGIGASRFFILNLIGALVWSVAVAFVGYLFGAAAKAVIVDAEKYKHQIILGILWVGGLVYIIYFLHKREVDRAEGRP